jgi:hypothetical protein
VEHLLHGSSANKELLADAAAFGLALPEAMLAPKVYYIWHEHLDVLNLFMRCMTQWRCGASGVVGLDYGVVLKMASLYQITEDLARVMEDLQTMELHARDLINKEAK